MVNKLCTTVLAVLLLLGHPLVVGAIVSDVDSGATSGFVDVTSSTAGVRIGPDALRTGMLARVKEGAAVPVCFTYTDRTANCATALTSADNSGYCASAGETFLFLVEVEHFRGQVCAILQSGAVAVRVPYNAW